MGYLIVMMGQRHRPDPRGHVGTRGHQRLRIAGALPGALTVLFDFGKAWPLCCWAKRFLAGLPGEAWILSLAGLLWWWVTTIRCSCGLVVALAP